MNCLKIPTVLHDEEDMKEESIELQMKTLDATDDSLVEDFRSLTSILYVNHCKKKNLKPGFKYIFRIRKCQLRQEKCSAVQQIHIFNLFLPTF